MRLELAGWAGMALLCVQAVVALMAGGCHAAPRDEADYVLAYLKTGPKSASLTKEERQAAFEGHMTNMKRLADEGKLVVAGPFAAPAHDPTWRGIFVLDVPTVAKATAVTETDPGMRSGMFMGEYRPMRSTVNLRRVMEFERQLTAGDEPKPGEPPKNIRAYVMVTASDADAMAAGLQRAGLADDVIWSGRFLETRPKGNAGGVWVIDSKSVDEVRAALSTGDAGEYWVDGWYSTVSVERLKRLEVEKKEES